MRPLSVITLVIASLLLSPMTLWSLGLTPRWMLEVHIIAFGLALRLLVMAASFARRAREIVWVGLYSGILSSLGAQILLHSPHAKANVAAAFSAYGALGSRLYQLDEVTRWWPYTLTLADGLFYGLLALLIFRYVTRLQPWIK